MRKGLGRLVAGMFLLGKRGRVLTFVDAEPVFALRAIGFPLRLLGCRWVPPFHGIRTLAATLCILTEQPVLLYAGRSVLVIASRKAAAG